MSRQPACGCAGGAAVHGRPVWSCAPCGPAPVWATMPALISLHTWLALTPFLAQGKMPRRGSCGARCVRAPARPPAAACGRAAAEVGAAYRANYPRWPPHMTRADRASLLQRPDRLSRGELPHSQLRSLYNQNTQAKRLFCVQSDVDCGGGKCPKCGVGKFCKQGTDCKSLLCTSGQSERGPGLGWAGRGAACPAPVAHPGPSSGCVIATHRRRPLKPGIPLLHAHTKY